MYVARALGNFLLMSGVAMASHGATGTASVADGHDFSAVVRYVDAGYRSLGLPGASLLVVHGDRVVHERHFGSYDASTVVPIASASKWLTAATILSLVDDGTLELDAPVSRYLPRFTGVKGTITLRQMLSHTSGLVEAPGEPRVRWDYDTTMAGYAERVAAADGNLAGAPGTAVRYTSVAMQVAGAVAEAVTGRKWDALFAERIAGPCDMPDTAFIRTPGTGGGDDLELPTANPMLAAGARSSLRDYGNFLQMLADGGVFRGRRVLSEASVREMQRDQTGTAPLERASSDRMGRASHYGLGQWLDVQAPDGRAIQVSSPGAWGFRPWLHLDRDLYAIFMMQRQVGAPATNATFDPWQLIDLVYEAVDRTTAAAPAGAGQAGGE
jgi:CubicO group peptidase (beta-lactamase class C family)